MHVLLLLLYLRTYEMTLLIWYFVFIADVIWPKDWMVQVLPPQGKDKWYYVIHERLEPPPQDDLKDPMYSGETILVLSHVPLACEAVDIKMWLLYGVAQDFEPLKVLRAEIDVTQRKKMVVKQKVAALPSMDVDGDPQQQAELRKKLADAIASHASRFDKQLEALTRRRKRIEKFLMTEPMQLSILPTDTVHKGGAGDAARAETRTWAVSFTSPRGHELTSVAMDKCDWSYVCLVQTRPQPKAFLEDDQVDHEVISGQDLAKEINMRTVRLRRLKHGEGEFMEPIPAQNDDDEDEVKKLLSPWDEDFHISSIGAMYAGQWRLGEKHGKGVEYTNAGFYDGEFDQNARHGMGKVVFGKGTTCSGTFERPSRRYEYGKKCKDRVYTPSLLNGDVFQDGVAQGDVMRITFPDGATYEGEMVDGKITGFGKYTSSTGVIDEGSFQDGLLHGEGCSRRFPDGSSQEGTFTHSQINGQGRQVERNGDSYDGFFENGVKQGRATAYLETKRSKHVGFWHENAMDGRGDFYYKQSSIGDACGSGPAEAAANADIEQEEKDESWDFWYEGSFLHGESVARHRHVDIHSKFPHHSPFTTNGKSSEKMSFLTDVLPAKLTKLEARGKKNALRRQQREKEFLEQREFTNLSLYYQILDEFYEKWALKKKNAKLDDKLTSDERRRVLEERAAMLEFEATRAKFRKEKYDLSPRNRELRNFEEYLERITLTEHVKLERAMASELTDMNALQRKAQSEGR